MKHVVGGNAFHGLPAAGGAFAATLLALSAALCAGCAPKSEEPGPAAIVLVVTPSEAAAPLAFRGAEALVAADAGRSGAGTASESYAVVRHVALPDAPKGADRTAALTAILLSAAKENLVRSVLAAPAPPGTADAFRALNSRRPDIVLVAADPVDDRLAIESSADLVVELDRLYRPYFAAQSAKAAGAKTLVDAAFAGSGAGARSREIAVLKAACAEFGLAYRLALAKAEDRDYAWLGELGPDSAVYCADSALAEAVAAAALATGAAVVDGGPDSLEAWRRTLGPGLPENFEKADAGGRRRLIEKAAVGLAGKGRIAVWTGGYGAEFIEGLGEFARGLALGKVRSDDGKAIVAALKSRSPGGAWIAAFDADPITGVKAANHLLIRQDPYVFGRGYSQSALRTVPPAYLAIGP